MKHLYLTCIFLWHGWCLLAGIPSTQQEAIRLNAEVRSLADSPLKLKKWEELGAYYENVNIDTALYCYNESLNLAKLFKNKESITTIAAKISFIYNLKGDFQKGLEMNQMAYNVAMESGDRSKLISPLANMGISYSYLNNYEKAVEHYERALKLAIETKDRLRTARMYGILAGTFNNMGFSKIMDSTLFEKSAEYGKIAIQMARELGDSLLLSDNLNVTALAYNNLERVNEAYLYAAESEKISKALGLTSNYAQALSMLAKFERKNGNYERAITLAETAVTLQKKLGSVMGAIIELKELALCYQYAGKYREALDVIQESIDLAGSQDMAYILDGLYINKGDYLYTLGRFKEAYDYLLMGHQLADSLRGIDMKNQINELELKYETDRKEQEIRLLSARQNLNDWIIMALITFLLAMLIIAFVTYKNFRYKSKINDQEKEQLKKEQRIQATASIIKGQEEERRRMAKDLHDGLGGILSGLKYALNNMTDNVIISGQSARAMDNAILLLDQAISEMRKVAHNMMPESLLKFGLDDTLKDYVSNINLSIPLKVHYTSYNYHRMDQSVEINLFRIVQEVINNTVKHAKAADLFIQMDVESDRVLLTLEDNGIGFDTAMQSSCHGMGLKNIKDRVNYLNGNLEISSRSGIGTLIVIEVKIQPL